MGREGKMNQKLGKVQMTVGVLILLIGLLSSFVAWFIGIFVMAFGIWNIFIGSQVRKGTGKNNSE